MKNTVNYTKEEYLSLKHRIPLILKFISFLRSIKKKVSLYLFSQIELPNPAQMTEVELSSVFL